MLSPMPARALYSELRRQSQQLADEFDVIYREAIEIWNEQYLKPFTTHGELHTKRVERNLDELTRPLFNSGGGLSAEEIFVLLAACCLHDIGMQLADDPQARTKHAQYSYELILSSEVWVNSEIRRVTLTIKDDNARRAIALIARGHWTDYALKLGSTDYIIGNERGRLRLLGVLLAMADLLDISPVRARYFRSIHRLFELPAVSELHQKMHRLVRGFQIYAPTPTIASDLQFRLEWQDNGDLVRRMSEWVMKWFDSQWRQLAPALYADSDGIIRWTTPWAEVFFNMPEGPKTELSAAAQKILEAELAQQTLINRCAFAKEFQDSISSGKKALFLFPVNSDMDGNVFSRWCEAHAKLQERCLVAHVGIQPTGALDVASIVSQILEQWGVHIPACTNDEALKYVDEFVSSNETHSLVSIIAIKNYRAKRLKTLLKVLLHHPGANFDVARVCLMLTDDQNGYLNDLKNIEIFKVDKLGLSQSDVVQYLREQLGYDEAESLRIYTKMSLSGCAGKPGKVYDYLNVHCGLLSEAYIKE